MNKKLKFAIPFAVLALSCGIAAAGCGGGGNGDHTHNFSDWDHNETQHWKKCPDDDAIDETSKANHVFVAGECECGATEKTGPVVQAKYGTVTGKVKLIKNGSQITDSTVLNGITVDMGDDKVEIAPSVADGVYTFNITNVEVGKTYELSITCTGYESYSTEILLEEENEVAPIGGANGITLNYEVFGLLAGYDGSYHDFSQVNENVIKFLENDGSKTLNVITKETYGDVSASLKLKFNNSTHSFHTQGIVLKFEDGKHLIVRYHNGDQRNGNIQYVNNAWDPCKAEDTLFGEEAGLNQWGEAPIHTLVDEETAAIKADGLDLNVVLKGGTLYSFFDGKFIAKYALPEGYAEKKVQVGYFAWNAASNAEFNYEISKTVPEKMETALDIKVTQPEGVTGCTVTATPEKQTYEFGEQIELAFTATEGYKLGTLTVGGADKLKSVMNGKLTITADRPSLEIVATYVQEEPIALNLTVKGKKLGTTAALAQGTTVSFKGTDYTFTVGADGKITSESVVKGAYTVVVDGYLEKEIEFNEELKEITLEYNTFKEILGWGDFDFSKQNDATPEFGITNDCSAIFTNDTYGDVKTSIYLKGNNMNAGNGGLLFRFVGEGLDSKGETVTVTMQGTKKVQFSQDNLWGQSTVATGCVWNNLYYFENCHDDDADRTAGANAAKYLEEYAAGTLKLSVVRKGATFYVFLDDALIGQMTVNEKYENAKCEVGFLSASLGNTSEWKSWKVEISQDVSLQSYTVTDGTAADAHGSVTGIPEEKVEAGETVTLTVTPQDGYKLSALKVNGVDVTAQMNGNTYDLVVAGDTTVVAEFAQIVPGSVKAVISGKKLGTTAPLAVDTQVTLTCQGLQDITAQITAEGLVVASIPAGEWTVNVDGYLPATITVENEVEYSQAITLEYDLMENLTVAWGWGDKASLDGQNDGKLTQLNGATQWVSSKDSYDSVAITATVVGGGNRQGVFIRFKGDSYANDKYAMIQKEGDQKVSWNGEGNIWGNGSNLCGDWTSYADPLTEADKTAIAAGEYELTLVRDKNRIHVFINGKYYDTKTLDAAYADAKCCVGVYCTDIPAGAERKFKIEEASQYLVDVSVTNGTATDAHGSITGVPAEVVKVGDKVTLTIVPNSGYKLSKLTVDGADVTAQVTGTTYAFVVTGNTSVSAEFTEIIPGSINAQISGNKFGVAGNSLTASDTVTLSASGFDNVNAQLATVNDNIVLTVDSIAAGTWTVNVDGYSPAEITVAENGEYTTAIALKPVEEFTLIQNWGSVSSVIAEDGSAELTITNELETAVSKTTYDDIAVTVNLSGTNMTKDGKTGTQGIVLRFSDDKLAILRMEGRAKIQFAYSTDWYQGGSADGTGWQDLIFFTEGDKYLTAFDKGELKLTAVRKGATICAILTIGEESEIIGCRTFADKYLTDKAKVGMFCEGTVNGAAKTWKFAVGDATAALAAATPAVGTDKVSYLGNWTEKEGTLAVSGKGLIEFKADAGTVKESVTVKISAANATGEQGIVYNFADGKFVAVRYQNSTDAATPHGKVQFTMDTVLFTNASLINWGFDYALTEAEKTAFDGSGINLTFVRNGNKFYVLLGDRLLGSQTVDETKYAAADGAMGIMIWGGSNSAFAYEHKMGENVIVPTTPETPVA